MILTHTYVFAGVMNSAALTHYNVASFSELTAEKLDTQTLAFRLTAVL